MAWRAPSSICSPIRRRRSGWGHAAAKPLNAATTGRPKSRDDLASPEYRTVHARWMSFPRPMSTAFPDLIVPYCDRAENGLHPLFRQAGANRIECFADLPASTLFTLCRVEETQQRHLD